MMNITYWLIMLDYEGKYILLFLSNSIFEKSTIQLESIDIVNVHSIMLFYI